MWSLHCSNNFPHLTTLMHVDDLLITYSSFEEASRERQLIEDTLLVSGIVRATFKDCRLQDVFNVSDRLARIGSV
jgi:hypothetical protein